MQPEAGQVRKGSIFLEFSLEHHVWYKSIDARELISEFFLFIYFLQSDQAKQAKV